MSDYTSEQWNGMVDLLSYIAAADRRTIGDTDVRVWLDAAVDGQWPSLEAAYRAVRLHRREQPGKWLEPGHVSVVLDRVRRAAADEFNRRELRPPREALDDPAEYKRWVQAEAEQFNAAAMARFVAGEQATLKAIAAAS